MERLADPVYSKRAVEEANSPGAQFGYLRCDDRGPVPSTNSSGWYQCSTIYATAALQEPRSRFARFHEPWDQQGSKKYVASMD